MVSLQQLTISILLLFTASVQSLDINVDDKDSICSAAKYVVQGIWNYYEGLKYGGTVGMFAPPNYWWNAGEAFGGLVDFYTYCQSDNSTLEKLIYNGMYHQAGENYNYIPSNQSMTEGNDDQGVWGMAIMEAVERNFTEPESHSWLEMVQAVFNTMNARWDADNCGGGLRWQIFTWNSGYDYKNSISNGCLFHLAARLARYTGNSSVYVDTAEKVWKWMEDVGFLTEEDNGDVRIYDGAKITNNCSSVTDLRWSYTYGVFMAGCAYLYNFTGDDVWLTRTNEIVQASLSYFFANKIMQETTCQPQNKCNNDQRSFRCLFSRCLGLTTQLAPETKDRIREVLEASAEGAAKSCSGGSDGVTCGENWAIDKWDGVYGLGEQTSALEVMMALIVEPPLSVKTGGTNRTDYSAGTNSEDNANKNELTITGKDKAGAGVLTAIVLAVILGGAIWMIF
ncbi:mannan endo-1,6-alpha-mannosidase [Candida albicans L26]|uniref:Mannan endo-1,6-alpha-mannosidase DFG5 n=1 Tax=Candida albicans (strain SC5314 / ATCC MYA-2876) TaxID=237561 RepID=DFG5_CANAL|nr:putative mannan endo-1,6-alpha-mannosidase [Candida albicans SC5314]Q5ACZ2.1 RecName: Full=Mannan endo-1,6-alpha-mannosidase DFG5; AltName: Full=Endo-alpha-1->6-D-mannanase DFG5; Flags: Precursor [Candida albicans SC5314]KGU15932.1 mannan endo-1,6-alpha-mannosidase [Candida albicans 19F]KGU16125.1 mannan endo-1,6-alpha-mannosidase [Candida albicans L26]AOW27106.1 putative mannan endo-1,6-alpha-mannosidase [Candida albicans SC5314]KHC81128.1 mannan endo-1,6-alpha-mannosidase [Candida albican|eukprot:XP_719522.1 putative mannan endo-1,6-alpha-mannosidase [Candida albicans SC5314]